MKHVEQLYAYSEIDRDPEEELFRCLFCINNIAMQNDSELYARGLALPMLQN
jgi:hypothetical protein